MEFHPDRFKKFLLERILTEIIACERHTRNEHTYLTVLGRLMEEYYLLQIRSDDEIFEDLQIIHLSPELGELLCKTRLSSQRNLADKTEVRI